MIRGIHLDSPLFTSFIEDDKKSSQPIKGGTQSRRRTLKKQKKYEKKNIREINKRLRSMESIRKCSFSGASTP